MIDVHHSQQYSTSNIHSSIPYLSFSHTAVILDCIDTYCVTYSTMMSARRMLDCIDTAVFPYLPFTAVFRI